VRGTGQWQGEKRCVKTLPAGEQLITLAAEGKRTKRIAQKGHEYQRLERRDVRGTGLWHWLMGKKRCMKALLAGEQHITIAAAQGKNAKWKATCEMSKFLHEAQFVCQNCSYICVTVNHKLDC